MSRIAATVKEDEVGQPVVHFEAVGRDGEKLQSDYSELFGWQIDANNPMGYGGHATFYVEVPDVEAALAKGEELGGSRLMGSAEVMPGLTIGQFTDPEGHMVGLVSGGSFPSSGWGISAAHRASKIPHLMASGRSCARRAASRGWWASSSSGRVSSPRTARGPARFSQPGRSWR